MMKELEFFKLEDRVLFEAAAAAEIVEAAEAAQSDPNTNMSESDRQAQLERDAVKNAPPENPADGISGTPPLDPADITDVDAEVNALIDGVIPSGGRELVVINQSVADKAAIIDSLQGNQEVLILGDGSGLAELNEFLEKSETVYSAIHLVTHGNDGYILVNGQVVDAENFDASAWQDIGEHLTENGDILLYGCNTAAGAEGQELIGMISDASGADVAASSDTTGISGNWDLEYSDGEVETGAIVPDDFSGNLQFIKVTTDSDTDDPADGVTSLREAISEANDNPGSKIIFDTTSWSDNVITLISELEITADVTITGDAATRITITTADDLIRIFNADVNNDISISISYLDLDGGDGLSDTSSIWSGGAIYINSGSGSADLTLDHVNITDSRGQYGGAVFINAVSDAKLTLKNVSISNCQAGDGGAVYLKTFDGNVSLDIVNSTLYNNGALLMTGAAGDGGAIYVIGAKFNINVVDSTVTGNYDHHYGFSGAAIFAQDSAGGSALNVLNSIVYGNYSINDSNTILQSGIYISSDDAGVNVVHSIYDQVWDGNNDTDWQISNSDGSVSGSTVSMEDIFAFTMTNTSNGATVAEFGNGVVQVNNQGVAGYGGVLTAYSKSYGKYIYDAGNNNWKDISGNAVNAPDATDIIDRDQLGDHRALAHTYLGIDEFFIGAVAGEIYLKVTPVDKTVEYNGQKHSTEVTYQTANPNGTALDMSNLSVSLTVTVSETAGADADTNPYSVTASEFKAEYDDDDDDVNVTDNFEVEYQTGYITITPKTVIVTVNTLANVTYGTDVTFDSSDYTVIGLVDSDTLTGNLAVDADSSTDYSSAGKLKAGTYDVIQGTLDGGSNYNIAFTEGSLTVDKLLLDLTLSVSSKAYDGSDAATLDQVTAGNVVSGDMVTVDFSSADAKFSDANAGVNKPVTVSGGLQLNGADGGNYQLQNTYTATGTITPKDVDVKYVTDEPYYYNGTDQKDSVSAYYEDINGNKVPLSVDWGGKSFTEPGSYTVTVTLPDGNYHAVNTSFTVVMNTPGIGGDYSDGLNPQFSGNIPSMQGDLTGNGIGGDASYGDIYTMNYSELVSHTMLRYNWNPGGGGETVIGQDDAALQQFKETVSLDALKFLPMKAGELIRESSVMPMAIPGGTIYADGENPLGDFWQVLPGIEALPEKADAFKGDLEKLLEELIEA